MSCGAGLVTGVRSDGKSFGLDALPCWYTLGTVLKTMYRCEFTL